MSDDERRALGLVLASPGITQIELRDRSGFSKSKVSRTVSALEKHGPLYRERQGCTYRIYPNDELRRKPVVTASSVRQQMVAAAVGRTIRGG